MFVKAFLLLVGLSAAHSIKCYMCVGKDCSQIMDCWAWPETDRCAISISPNQMVNGCVPKAECRDDSVYCCEGDLCNGTGPSGPTVLLLLVSSAIFTLFL